MSRRILPLPAWIALLALLSCSQGGGRERTDMPDIGTACSQWCESAYRKEAAKTVCAQGCGTFLEGFRACLGQNPSCRKARQCALDAMRASCARRAHDAEACALGGDYAYKLSLDYCIDRAEKL